MQRGKKQAQKESFNYSVELIGLLLILIGIIGFGFGPIGEMIKQFAMFIVGEWWALILLFLLFMGLYMLIKRKLPNFFTCRLLGLYIFIIVILTASHCNFINNFDSKEIIGMTNTRYQERIDSMVSGSGIFSSGDRTKDIGGGIVGAACALGFDSLFGKIDAKHKRR